MKAPLILAGALLLANAPAEAAKVIVTVKTHKGVGKRVTVFWIENGTMREEMTDRTGNLPLDVVCSSSVVFSINQDEVVGQITPKLRQPCKATVKFIINQI